MKKIFFVSLFLILTACQQSPPKQQASIKQSSIKEDELNRTLLAAEKKASKDGKRVLSTGRQMALMKREVIKGSCWDYANAVYKRAGYVNNKNRKVVFSGEKQASRRAAQELIQPGDFLYYINHSYHDSEHSAIFVDWLNYDDKIGLMLSYAGEQKKAPARYRPYDLSDVYHIIRPFSRN